MFKNMYPKLILAMIDYFIYKVRLISPGHDNKENTKKNILVPALE